MNDLGKDCGSANIFMRYRGLETPFLRTVLWDTITRPDPSKVYTIMTEKIDFPRKALNFLPNQGKISPIQSSNPGVV